MDGNSSEASFENEKQPIGCRYCGQVVSPGQPAQLLPCGPPAPLYSSALNWYTVTGSVLVKWYAPPGERTVAETGTAAPQLSASGPFSSGTQGRKNFCKPLAGT